MSSQAINLPVNDEVELATILENTLHETFKLAKFRDGQLQGLIKLLKTKSLLCIQPTGHGKSLLYQLPSVLLPGITIVISPLLALMRDQIHQLETRFNINAASINSDQTHEENQQAKSHAAQGKLKILFIAPEKLDNLEYLEFLYSLPISLIVIDEAHCISTWGHDFRPSYRQIINFATNLKNKNSNIHLLALTATANKQTQDDIINQLSNQENTTAILRQSMDRPNLMLHTVNIKSTAEKLYVIQEIIKKLSGSGLIYCATRDHTQLVNDFLNKNNIKSSAYHAGINPDYKRELQNDFINNKFQVIAATNALGMGIDKADLRYIIHFDMPGSITAYYQEIGRAGRDGLPAYGILLFNEKDKKIQQHFINSAQPSCDDFNNILTVIKQSEETLALIEIKRLTGLHPTRVLVVISELIEQGFLEKKRVVGKQVYIDCNQSQNLNLDRYENQHKARQQELTNILSYGHNNQATCLMATLRTSLGDKIIEPCQHCSYCKENIFYSNASALELQEIEGWLYNQSVVINLGQQKNCLQGKAVLNSKLRQPLFIEFMKQRQLPDINLNKQLLELIKNDIKILKNNNLVAIVCIPSRTWGQKDFVADFLSQELDIPIITNCLEWLNLPNNRQGELLNNDQRRFNVKENMAAQFKETMPVGNILLVDDYIGSNATMKEAARALVKQAGFRGNIMPFTIASVTWRLGQSGMI